MYDVIIFFDMMINKINDLFMYEIFGLPFAVLFSGLSAIFLILYLKFINFRFIKDKTPEKPQNLDGISKLKAFASASAGTLGIGNIFGGAMAVTIAGAGSIFWIFILGIFASIIKFCEVYLGHKYRKTINRQIHGGSFFYIRDAFKFRFSKHIAVLYAVVFIIAYIGAGTFQIHQIASMAKVSFVEDGTVLGNNISLIIAIPTAIFTCFILFGGVAKIANVLTAVIPAMAISYFIATGFICVRYSSEISGLFSRILADVLNPSLPLGFVLGYCLHRILFASDAGTGVSAIANAQANTTPLKQAKLVALEPILVSLAMCMTGFVVLLTGSDILAASEGLSGVQIVHHAFDINFLTEVIFFIVVCLFGVSTTLAHGYNVSEAAVFLFGKSGKKYSHIFYTIAIVFVAQMTLDKLVPIIDMSFMLSIFINVGFILFASRIIKKDLL